MCLLKNFQILAAGYYQNQTHNQYRNCSNPVSCKLQLLMQYMDSGKLTTATHIPTAVVYLVIPISMALAIVHTIVDIKEDFAPAKTETAESEGAEL